MFFTQHTLTFLRALKRNNNRAWFAAHRDDFEHYVRAPMMALVERLGEDFERLAPELVATPKASIFRIYRDTRFSHDKAPFKTHASARFPPRGLGKGLGAGLYLRCSVDRGEVRLKPETTYCRSLPGRVIPGEAVATGPSQNVTVRRDIDEVGVGRLDLAQDLSRRRIHANHPRRAGPSSLRGVSEADARSSPERSVTEGDRAHASQVRPFTKVAAVQVKTLNAAIVAIGDIQD
jgi:hypothetical protein